MEGETKFFVAALFCSEGRGQTGGRMEERTTSERANKTRHRNCAREKNEIEAALYS